MASAAEHPTLDPVTAAVRFMPVKYPGALAGELTRQSQSPRGEVEEFLEKVKAA